VKVLLGAAALLAVFLTVLVFTLPIEPIVRTLLARAGGTATAVDFRHASLRPWGIVLDDVVIRRPVPAPPLHVDSVRIRPSLTAFLHDPAGRPWYVAAAACEGTADAVVAPDDTVSVTWRDVRIDRCPGLDAATQGITGASDGSAIVRSGPAEALASGTLVFHHVLWKPPGITVPGLDGLHADTASLRWTVRGDQIALDDVALDGPDVNARGSGTVGRSDGALSLRLVVTAPPASPPTARRLLQLLPPAPDGAGRLLVLEGTIETPHVVLR
jgi:type II secretion system protein N